MSTLMDEDDWSITLTVFRICPPRRGRKAADDPAVPGGAACLHGGERALAGFAGTFWKPEHRVEALRPAWQGGRKQRLQSLVEVVETLGPGRMLLRPVALLHLVEAGEGRGETGRAGLAQDLRGERSALFVHAVPACESVEALGNLGQIGDAEEAGDLLSSGVMDGHLREQRLPRLLQIYPLGVLAQALRVGAHRGAEPLGELAGSIRRRRARSSPSSSRSTPSSAR